MAQKKHSGWERKRVRLIQNKLLKRAAERSSQKPSASPVPQGQVAAAPEAGTTPQ